MHPNPNTMAHRDKVPPINAPPNLPLPMPRMPRRLPGNALFAVAGPGAVPKPTTDSTSIRQMLPPPVPTPQGISVPEALALSMSL